jgi:2-C-methyl-D-erythritol 4-phosphate cytidylyltransferase
MKNVSDPTDPDFKNLSIIVPAAGRGLRMGADVAKQYMLLNGVPVLQHTLERLLLLGPNKIVLVVSENDEVWRSIKLTEQCCIVTGGATRSDSVLNGINALGGEDNNWVMVHDSVRPCVRLRDIVKLFSELKLTPVGGLLGIPVIETLKKASVPVEVEPEKNDSVEKNQEITRVLGTVPREEYWLAQTPQVFRLGLLRSALQQARAQQYKVTDEASAIEMYGQVPIMVKGSKDNIKITTPEDLALAEYFLRQQADDQS